MTLYCAIPPVDMAVGHVGRGYGMGWNRLHTRADQLHGGQDFMVGPGTPIVAPLPGRVVLVSHNDGPGYNRAMTGYGNAVVLQHDFSLPIPTTPLPGETRPSTRGLPSPFWTSYNHMREAPAVVVGQRVMPGTVLGYVGNTNNGAFPGMPSHLHVEVRKRMFPSSYDNDTINPDLLWASLGIEHTGAHREAGRMVGGVLQARAGGPSDCRSGQHSDLSGGMPPPHPVFEALVGTAEGVETWDRYGKLVWRRGRWVRVRERPPLYGLGTAGQAGAGEQYVSPAAISSKYAAGTVAPEGADVDPPDYKAVQPSTGPSPLFIGGTILVGVGFAWWMGRRERRQIRA